MPEPRQTLQAEKRQEQRETRSRRHAGTSQEHGRAIGETHLVASRREPDRAEEPVCPKQFGGLYDKWYGLNDWILDLPQPPGGAATGVVPAVTALRYIPDKRAGQKRNIGRALLGGCAEGH